MIIIYSILLYLHAITPVAPYTQQQMDAIILSQQQQILTVQQSPDLMQNQIPQYNEEAGYVTIFNPDENP